MMMAKISVNLVVGALLLAYLPAEGQDMSQAMDTSEQKFNEAQSRRVVAFMSLNVMFPDAQVRALAKAAGDGDVKKVEQLVNGGVSVNSRGAQGATPLFWAMHNLEGFKKLLELGADPNVVFADGNSVMNASVVLKEGGILKAALAHGGNPNLVSSDSFGYTPIFDAMSAGLDRVDMLLSAGADINAKSKFGSTPVLVAAGRGDYEMVYRLLERGADYRIKDAHGVDLAAAVSKNVGRIRPGTKWAKWQDKVIEWLLAKGVKIPASPQSRPNEPADQP